MNTPPTILITKTISKEDKLKLEAEWNQPTAVTIIENKKPIIGVGVCILNSKNEILLGTRLKKFGYGKYSFPGGKLEFGETVFECAVRKVKEEVNLDLIVDSMSKIGYTEDIIEGEHYLTLYVLAKCSNELEIKNMEPDKMDKLGWFMKDFLPGPLWEPIVKLFKANSNYFSSLHNLVCKD